MRFKGWTRGGVKDGKMGGRVMSGIKGKGDRWAKGEGGKRGGLNVGKRKAG